MSEVSGGEVYSHLYLMFLLIHERCIYLVLNGKDLTDHINIIISLSNIKIYIGQKRETFVLLGTKYIA